MRARYLILAGAAIPGACLLVLAACGGGGGGRSVGSMSGYTVTKLVADDPATKYTGGPAPAAHIDPLLKNPWGIVFNPAGFVWVANNHTDTSTLYDGGGTKQSLTVTLPSGTSPTGIVFNGDSSAFGGAIFIFDGEGGTVAAWSSGTAAQTKFTAADGAVYKGLALIGACLYAADFRNAKLDVFDTSFAKVTATGGTCPPGSAFADASLPAGFAPFGIQNLGGKLYVAYAKQAANGVDDQPGAGNGYVNRFNADGSGRVRFASQGMLDSPWGLAQAPGSFGAFSGDILIGNFGDGRINAFDPNNGQLLGTLADSAGTPIAIDGLWGIAFGNGLNSQPTNTLFFAAGPNAEANGIYGRIDCNGC